MKAVSGSFWIKLCYSNVNINQIMAFLRFLQFRVQILAPNRNGTEDVQELCISSFSPFVPFLDYIEAYREMQWKPNLFFCICVAWMLRCEFQLAKILFPIDSWFIINADIVSMTNEEYYSPREHTLISLNIILSPLLATQCGQRY